jgi:protein-tyrosine phosphatase
MIDLHCHILPGIDDGAADIATSVAMARMFVADGISCVACTPHILPGLYNNVGPQIRQSLDALRTTLDNEAIELALVCGSDAHICPDFVAGLRQGRILSIADGRFVLVEPPHHVAPQRMEQFFFDVLVAGYIPILTHPERLRWIGQQYETIKRLTHAGVWNQITSSSLTGAFGKNAQYWAERMLDEGLVHVLASDAHDTSRRVPNLSRGRDAAARRVGDTEAEHLVSTRPRGVLANEAPANLPAPPALRGDETAAHDVVRAGASHARSGGHTWGERLRRVFR